MFFPNALEPTIISGKLQKPIKKGMHFGINSFASFNRTTGRWVHVVHGVTKENTLSEVERFIGKLIVAGLICAIFWDAFRVPFGCTPAAFFWAPFRCPLVELLCPLWMHPWVPFGHLLRVLLDVLVGVLRMPYCGCLSGCPSDAIQVCFWMPFGRPFGFLLQGCRFGVRG